MKKTAQMPMAPAMWSLAAILSASCLTEREPPPPPADLEARNRALAEVEKQFAILERADGPAASKILSHGDQRVRARAARRLGDLGQNAGDAGPALIETLEDEDRTVRLEAAAALGNVKDERALEPLVEALVDKDAKVRLWAWKSLKAMQASSLPVLISHLKSSSPLRKLFFKDEAGSKQILRNEIIRLMALMGEAPVPVLIEALSDSDKWLKRTAATVLGEIGPKAAFAVPKLIVILGESADSEQRVQIARALGKIGEGSEAVMSALRKSQEDSNKSVAKEARKAIKALDDAAKKKEQADKIKQKTKKEKPRRPPRPTTPEREK